MEPGFWKGFLLGLMLVTPFWLVVGVLAFEALVGGLF